MDDKVIIGIGDYAVVRDHTPISTVGLGSCVGVVLYDPSTNVSGMSHIMLPQMGQKQDKIGKYADTAIPALIEEMKKAGANVNRMKAKIAGGASLFDFTDDNLQIGLRNAEAVKSKLKEYHIQISNEDLGGNRGRTITFFPESKELLIKMVRKGPEEAVERII